MPDITVSLTDTENKALEYAVNVQEWSDNALQNRARQAKDEIIEKLIAHCNENSIAIAVGESAQVDQAYDLGIIQTAVERDAAFNPA